MFSSHNWALAHEKALESLFRIANWEKRTNA
jgi:hypothetical protein